jgi:hypothetical protein
MKYLFFAIPAVFLVFVGWTISHPKHDLQYEINRLTHKTAEKLRKQEDLFACGTGGGMEEGKILCRCLSFQFFHEVDLEKARKLLVRAIDQYLADINASENINPYLMTYPNPFMPKNLEIRIWIYKPDGSSMEGDNIYYVQSIDGILEYYPPIRPEDTVWTRRMIHKETYEEAINALKTENSL